MAKIFDCNSSTYKHILCGVLSSLAFEEALAKCGFPLAGLVFGLYTCFDFVVVGFVFSSYIGFGLHTPLDVASLHDGLFFAFMLLGFLCFCPCLIRLSEKFHAFRKDL